MNLQSPDQQRRRPCYYGSDSWLIQGTGAKAGGLSSEAAHHLPHLLWEFLVNQFCQLDVPGACRAQEGFRCVFHLDCGVVLRVARVAFLGHIELLDGLDQFFRSSSIVCSYWGSQPICSITSVS